MKIHDAIHALILFDQKKIIPRKTLFRSSLGTEYKFIRVDTQLNWPRVIVEDLAGEQFILNQKEFRLQDFIAIEPEIRIVPCD